jgi:hypothetical protein
MELPVASLRAEDPANFQFIRVVDDRWLRYRWRLGGSRRCIAVKQGDVENVVFLDRIWEV